MWAIWASRWARFGDARLGQRLTSLLVNFAKNPEGSVSQAAGAWKGTKATYRFFDNPRVAVDRIAAAERKATVQRLRGAELVLGVQDTTALNFTGLRGAEGLGPRHSRQTGYSPPSAPEA